MKIYHSLFATLILLSFPCVAFFQTWEYLTPIRSYTQIKGCSFLDENRGVAVSYIDDDIIMTLDGGDSWQGLAGPPTVGTAMDIEWVSEDLFIIAASNGDIFRTSNGGASWQNMNPPATDWLYNVDFINETTGFVTGNNGVLLKTSDAGLTWTLIPTGTTNRIVDVDFSDELNGCAAAWNGTLLRTTDGGNSWSIISIPSTTNLQSVQFVDANTGFAVGGVILKTTDGGMTWSSVYSDSGSFFYLVHVNPNGQGYAVGASGVFAKTSNMGSTWQIQTPLGNGNIFCGDHTATGEAYLFGEKNIHKSINGGNSWTVIKNEAPGGNVNDIQFAADNTGWAVSSAIGGNNNGGIARTTDGGRTWNILQTASSGGWYAVDFPTSQTGYALGTSLLAKTTNGGQNWSYTTPFTLSGKCLHFRNAQTGFAGGLGSGSNICKTINGATSFTCGNNIGAAAIYFINDQKGIAIRNITGSDTYYKTFDGGNTWEYHNGLLGNSIEFFGEQKGWVGGYSGVYRTTDGGDTWEFVFVGSNLFLEVRFFDENTGYCVSDEGLIFRTTNGGVSWEYAFPNEEIFLGALCAEITENYCYIGTAWGGVYRTSLGCTGEGPYPCVVSCPTAIEISSSTCGNVGVSLNNNNLENVIWNFGDGSQDTIGVAASHYYPENGIYTITAEFSSSDCALNLISDTIVVNCHLDDCPTGFLVQSDSCNLFHFSVVANDTTAFVDWDFGDGQMFSGLTETQHVFSANGVYLVTAVYNANTCPIPWTQAYTIEVDCPVVDCSMEIFQDDSVCGVYGFELSNSSDGYVEWNFGDGTSGVSGSAVNHTYAENGTYIVTAAFSGGDCPATTYTDTLLLNCLYNNCPSGIIATSSSCDTYTFQLVGGEEGEVTWSFGDGDTASSNTIIEHVFPGNGLYVITAEYNGLSCPQPWTNVYTVAISCPVCPTAIEINSDSCANYSLSLLDATTGNVEWSFGDGSPSLTGNSVSHNYTENGEYLVLATLSGVACPLSTFTDTIAVTCLYNNCPSGIIATSSSCDTYTFELVGGEEGEVTWSFGDGDTVLSNTIIEHVFPGNGLYVITAEYNGLSCPQPWTNVYTVAVSCEECDAHFTVTETSENGLIILENTSSYSGDAVFEFDFANGGMDLGNGWVQYDEDGNYTICLLLNTPVCTDVYCDTLTIQGIVPVCLDNPLLMVTTLENPSMNDSVRIVIIDTDTTWYSGEWHQPESQGDTVHLCLPDGCFEITMMSQSGLSASWAEGQILPVSGASVTNGIIHLGSGGMISTTYVGVNVECAVSTPMLSEITFKSFPNPASTFTIESSEIVAEVYIYNSDGRQVMTHRPNCDRFNCDLSLYPPGIYALRLLTASGKSRCVFQVVE